MPPTTLTSTRGPRFLWLAAGCPMPVQTDGIPILPRDMRANAERDRRKLAQRIAVARPSYQRALQAQLDAITDTPHCASCGEPASYRLDDAISDSFTTVKNANRAWSFGGERLCQACVWACKTLALRCALFFATLPSATGPGGLRFHPIRPIPGRPETRPDPLAVLLDPPEPPFVAGLPLYGIDHGGEANLHRAIWPTPIQLRPGDGPVPEGNMRPMAEGSALFVPFDPLIKLQSKHTALYTQVSLCRDRYRLQIDDTSDVTVDVPLWRALRRFCDALLLDLRQGGVGAQDARTALETLRSPARAPLPLLARWGERVAPLKPHAGAPWWGLFVNLLLMPELVKTVRPTR